MREIEEMQITLTQILSFQKNYIYIINIRSKNCFKSQNNKAINRY